ncbi:ribosomal protein L22/L17 [Tuber borchii]|uniref:Ribosomal protein L22/L17 n=1 Tax=Tuber borchii TaxID=42251 RepID=A0A2T6ZCI4_TUBBO|nr:ribosomal protein L22/L17 [Tuber borchii]
MSAITATGWLLRPKVTHLPPPTIANQSRTIKFMHWGGNKDLKLSEPTVLSVDELLKQSPKIKPQVGYNSQRGGLAASSIFGDESTEVAATESSMGAFSTIHIRDPNREHWAWPKRATAREVRRRGRLTKREMLLQTEKEHLAKSHMFKTSVKKLAPIARQIQGKKIEDAIIQMRFSPKGAARDVLGHLYAARNESVVRRKMDPEQTYIEQAWVGRGTYEVEHNHRARGRIDMLKLPYTSITVVLKEQVTRDRIAKEKEDKRLRKKPWEQLPSRPLVGQTQYYRW